MEGSRRPFTSFFKKGLRLFRIDAILAEDFSVTLALSGELSAECVSETQARIEQLQQRRLAVRLDLAELRRVDRSGIALLLWAARRDIPLLHPAPYVLTWLKQEHL
jgi:hypothetical protein